MGKSKRHHKKMNKSKKIKRGGRKNNQNQIARLSSQMYGGSPFTYNTILSNSVQSGGQANAPAPRPAPAPASLLNLGNLDEQSVITALQSFGDAANILQYAVSTGGDAAEKVKEAAEAQITAFESLKTSVETLYNAISGNDKLYMKIVGSPFIPGPLPPAPPPSD